MKLQTSRTHRDTLTKWNTIGDWVATVLVCLTLLGMLSAMLAVVLGDAR